MVKAQVNVKLKEKGKAILQRIEKIREGTEAYPSAGQALVEAHEEEDT